MANIRSEAEAKVLHSQILTAATAMFMQKGFEKTTITDIAMLSGVPKSKILYEMNSKEEILERLVTKFLDGVTEASDSVTRKLTDNKIFIFMANEVLQIYMAGISEDMRNLYLSAYSMRKTSEAVLKRRTQMLFEHFSDMFPDFSKKDFYELEIASIGIMRSYMSVPCDMYFTKEAKVSRLVSTMLKIYDIPESTIDETLDFLKKIDFEAIARNALDNVFRELDIKACK